MTDAETEPLATAAQLRMLFALCQQVGLTNRDERLAACARVLGREVPTSKTLTRGEASRVIDHLQAERLGEVMDALAILRVWATTTRTTWQPSGAGLA
jgi:hypothetical protein